MHFTMKNLSDEFVGLFHPLTLDFKIVCLRCWELLSLQKPDM